MALKEKKAHTLVLTEDEAESLVKIMQSSDNGSESEKEARRQELAQRASGITFDAGSAAI